MGLTSLIMRVDQIHHVPHGQLSEGWGGALHISCAAADNLFVCRPDTMFSFDHATGVMYTCDAFGAHYATDAPFDTELSSLSPHFRFYYDCLMRPNARSVLTALRKVKDLDYTTIATGHGPIIRYNLEELIGR